MGCFMAGTLLDRDRVYGSIGQKIAKVLHFVKARYRSKERKRVRCFENLIPRNGVVVDVGANMGYFAKEFAKIHGGSCFIYCFEPVSYNYSILERVVSQENVVLEKLALSKEEGVIDIYIPVKKQGKIGPGLAHFGKEERRDYIVESVQMVTLDDYLDGHDITALDFIKCDVEGAELFVYQGGIESIRRYKPAIYSEINDDYTQRVGYRAQEIFDLLLGCGYEAFLVDGGGCELKSVKKYTAAGDYLFKV